MNEKKPTKPRKKEATKKPTTRKTTTTRSRTTRQPKKEPISKLNILIVCALVLVVFIGFSSSLFYYLENRKVTPKIEVKNTTIPSVAKIPEIEKNTTNITATESNKTLIVAKNETTQVAKNETVTVAVNTTVVPPKGGKKPYLVLVIDDVVFKSQIDEINSIPLKLTPSFLPPSKDSPNSNKYVKYAKFNMVHLPLEAENFQNYENSLLVSDTYSQMYE
ncbi:MAG: divergent polysaccharide deacetylase family protein, partial [Campylobacteraceae bacterium]